MKTKNIKQDLKRTLLECAKISRIHIVGCQRSGTTMLHYSMSAFQNTILYDREISMWNHPSIKEAFKLFLQFSIKRGKYFFVTKRNSGWWIDNNIEALAQYTLKNNVTLINLIRDPRDVLTSRHSLDKRKYYVDVPLWVKIMNASEQLSKYLSGYDKYLILRYEDILRNTEEIEKTLNKKIGVQLKNCFSSWSRLKENVEAIKKLGMMVPYMHNLRNFDQKSIGRWKNESESYIYIKTLLDNSNYSNYLKDFLKRYNYQ